MIFPTSNLLRKKNIVSKLNLFGIAQCVWSLSVRHSLFYNSVWRTKRNHKYNCVLFYCIKLSFLYDMFFYTFSICRFVADMIGKNKTVGYKLVPLIAHQYLGVATTFVDVQTCCINDKPTPWAYWRSWFIFVRSM